MTAPSSKSVTHRALIVAALADGDSDIARPLDSRDTRVTAAGLEALGVPVSMRDDHWIVHGRGGRIPGGGRLDLEESGTSLRFLTAVAALGDQASRLDGSPRLRERPLGELISAVRSLGAGVEGDRLPIDIGGTLFRGGETRIDGSQSSQFASALMLVAPCLEPGLTILAGASSVSLPYIELTREVMRDFGVEVSEPQPHTWCVRAGHYTARTFEVDGDHSSASYFLAAPLLVGGRVRMNGLDPGSAQADATLQSFVEMLGARVDRGEQWIEVQANGTVPPFDVSLAHAPDLVPTVAVLGLFAEGPSMIRDIAHLRLKESDRIEQLAINLRRLGCEVELDADRLSIGSKQDAPREVTIKTAGDHRMAMAFALAGLRVPGVCVDDPDCVAKSNPRFWKDWESMLAD
ncbi:MAG: 3-phosphoshikimate 1-carboxyvinyltransferase [Acidobacteria bacterium]|nr:3-phosphoshikimate 1-carboxyvinyltransferase [Acidobacteriota bacterium]NIM60232.1 3-phosphoshikimate 1-carboxyvinyltransferase [Acidobacteriota bacterium]NIO60270.1 3-phosphoshikimate 1-carboxyvinyltransferase [Acidobacteriota bacterium]NIQ31325.1 3-phosphoshikimate 1-carboxyvinyltransferase [Acidobacteriota bacterium]NIQ86548.1 3-phosphoshikimate 1-carboxyvinyltransferase [Acidobacteriota bacterium]